jgi:hypothetical protein
VEAVGDATTANREKMMMMNKENKEEGGRSKIRRKEKGKDDEEAGFVGMRGRVRWPGKGICRWRSDGLVARQGNRRGNEMLVMAQRRRYIMGFER